MPLWLFALVWLAAWAVAWWWFRPRLVETVFDPPKVVQMHGFDARLHYDEQWVPGRRRLAPFLATAVAFAAEAAWLVLS